jgi:nucleoid DNA-binding protein
MKLVKKVNHIIVEKLYNEKQKELREFGFIDWEEKEEKDSIF